MAKGDDVLSHSALICNANEETIHYKAWCFGLIKKRVLISPLF